jgi:hypothetical protein
MVLDGEKPDIYSLPRPDWYFTEVDERKDPYMRWKACWEGDERCLEVRRSASENLMYWKKVLETYGPVDEESRAGSMKDREYLLGLTAMRINRWDALLDLIDRQFEGPI